MNFRGIESWQDWRGSVKVRIRHSSHATIFMRVSTLPSVPPFIPLSLPACLSVRPSVIRLSVPVSLPLCLSVALALSI